MNSPVREETEKLRAQGLNWEDIALLRKIRKIENRLREVDAARPRAAPREDVVTKDAVTLGIDPGKVMFGITANKPTSSYLLQRGVRFLAYFDTDTNTLYAWNGLAWTSTALS